MSRIRTFSAAVLAVAIVGTSAYAADSISIMPSLGVVTNGASSDIVAGSTPTTIIGNTVYIYSAGPNAVYTINYSASATLASGEQFGSVEFGVNGTSGLTLGSYTPDNSSGAYVSDGSVLVNGSFGPNPSTLQQIAASVGMSSTFTNFAITTPAAVGSIAVAWNGSTAQSLTISDGNGNAGQIQFASENSTTGLLNPEATAADTWTVDFVPALQGDANYDGNVNGLDLITFAHNYGQTEAGGPSVGDFNSDGTVNGLDLIAFAHNYGSVWTNGLGAGGDALRPAIAATPEPASLGLLALGGLAMLRRRRKA